MGAKFFSQRMPRRSADAGDQVQASEIGLDRQQELVLNALRRAEGAPVSYAALREAGVELPASVVSELELAGVAIERCSANGRAVGVRLDPADDPARAPSPDPVGRSTPADVDREPAWGGVRKYRASSLEGFFLMVLGWLSRPTKKGERESSTTRPRTIAAAPPAARDDRRGRALAVTALLAGIAVIAVLGSMWAAGGNRGTPAPIAKRPRSRVVAAATATRPSPAPRSTHPSPPAPPVPVSPVLATNLEAQGHSLMEAGQYDAAVPVLKRAVLATGERLGGCLVPASSTCLTYAYALYDLGRATRLSGEPEAAVPILERRLAIDNQRGVVSAELQLARQGIS